MTDTNDDYFRQIICRLYSIWKGYVIA